jgi:hypothetical protein
MDDTATSAVDYLKYLVALCITIIERVQGDLGGFNLSRHTTPRDRTTAVARLDAVWHALAGGRSVLHSAGDDLDRYSDGRPVATTLNMGPARAGSTPGTRTLITQETSPKTSARWSRATGLESGFMWLLRGFSTQ